MYSTYQCSFGQHFLFHFKESVQLPCLRTSTVEMEMGMSTELHNLHNGGHPRPVVHAAANTHDIVSHTTSHVHVYVHMLTEETVGIHS